MYFELGNALLEIGVENVDTLSESKSGPSFPLAVVPMAEKIEVFGTSLPLIYINVLASLEICSNPWFLV